MRDRSSIRTGWRQCSTRTSSQPQIAKLRHDRTAAVAGIARLLELVERGLMEPEDPAMRERLVALKLQRDQMAKEIGELQNRMASSTPTITPEKVTRVGLLLRDKLYEGPPEFRQAYARLLMDEVRVTEEEIRISGSKSVLARCTAQGVAEPVPKVLSFVQEWRAGEDKDGTFRGGLFGCKPIEKSSLIALRDWSAV